MVRFRNTNDLKEYLARIVESEHKNLGKWTTAQIFYHLAAAFEASVDAAPLAPGFPRIVRWIVRPCRRFVTHVRFPLWLPIPASIRFKLEPSPNAEFAEQYSRLLDAIVQFEMHTGAMPPHPVLGKLTPTEWLGFHLRHCEHHLSFIELADVAKAPRSDS